MDAWTERVGAIVVAAGKGSRMGDGVTKQFRLWQGKPVWMHAVHVLLACPFDAVVVVVPPQEVASVERQLAEVSDGGRCRVVAGGRDRQQSVYAGLCALAPFSVQWVCVHDGVRPRVTVALVDRCVTAALSAGDDVSGFVAAVPVTDTIKYVEQGRIARTLPRELLWAAQTPQVFAYDVLRRAHEQAMVQQQQATDDAALVEAIGYPVRIVEGDPANSKITTETDWQVLLRAETAPAFLPSDDHDHDPIHHVVRVGYGYDVHPWKAGRPCVLGGVTIPSPWGLDGHSDADVLLHAVADAILGAIGAGDIGQHFPNTDERWRGADSMRLLEHVWRLATEQRYRLVNVDCTIVAEQPRIVPHVPQMKANLAAVLHVGVDRINIKATTSEKLGFVGRHEGAVAHAIVGVVQQQKGES